MNKQKRMKIYPGLYRVYWKGGGQSLASVGVTINGDRWIAPTNWVFPSEGWKAWRDVEAMQRINAH